MDSVHQDDAPQGMDTDLDPLRQEQTAYNSHETSTEGKKLRQYLAAISGKNQGCSTGEFASLIMLRDFVCNIFCYISFAILQL